MCYNVDRLYCILHYLPYAVIKADTSWIFLSSFLTNNSLPSNIIHLFHSMSLTGQISYVFLLIQHQGIVLFLFNQSNLCSSIVQADDVVTAPVAVEPAAVKAVLTARRLAVSQVRTPARVRLVELQVDPVHVPHG